MGVAVQKRMAASVRLDPGCDRESSGLGRSFHRARHNVSHRSEFARNPTLLSRPGRGRNPPLMPVPPDSIA